MSIIQEAEKFIPFALQKETPKQHLILINRDFNQFPGNDLQEVVGKLVNCCDTKIDYARIDHNFGWGDECKLNIVTPDILVGKCKCGGHTYISHEPGKFIQLFSRSIRRLYESPSVSELTLKLDSPPPFLTTRDLAKVYDFGMYIIDEVKDMDFLKRQYEERWR